MSRLTEAIKSVVFRSEFLTAAMRRLRVLVHYARGKPHEADFHFLGHPAFASGLLLDLGANVGQSALSVASVQRGLKIHSIEANPACEPGLRTAAWLLGRRYRYQLVGVGGAAGVLAFHVPVRSSRMLLEEGTFDPESLLSPNSVARIGREGQDYTLKVISIPIVTVDSLNLAPRVVKMDLQGLELARPVFMIEIGERHDEIVAHLAARGYARFHWDGARLRPGVQPDTLNAIFIATGDPAWPADASAPA